MSRVPPRTPPVDRLLDRNKFAGRIDGETERRLRAVEKAAEDAKGTTVTQTITNTTTGGGSGSIPGNPTQYSAAVVAPQYPVSLGGTLIASGPQSFVIDDANDLGFGAGALVVGFGDNTSGSTRVRVYSPGNLNNFTDFPGGIVPRVITLMPGAIVINDNSSSMDWWRIGVSTSWSALDTNERSVPTRVGNVLWWFRRYSTTTETRYMTTSLSPQTALTGSVSAGMATSPHTTYVAGPTRHWVWQRSSGTNVPNQYFYRLNDTTSPWVSTNLMSGWPSTSSGTGDGSASCADAEGLWHLDSGRNLRWVRHDGLETTYNDVLPFAVKGRVRLVALGDKNFACAATYTSGSTNYESIWNISPLGSTQLWDGPGGLGDANALGAAANGDLYARFGHTLVRITPS